MKDLYIIGAGGSGREVAEIVKDINKINPEYKIIGFVDDNQELWGTRINDIDVLGGSDFLLSLAKEKKCYTTISIADCQVKEMIVNTLGDSVEWVNIIHPSANMFSFVKLGVGVIIEPFVCIGPNAKIGNHVFINTKTNIGHDSVIGDFSSLMCMCDITGNVNLEEKVYVASSVSVVPGITIGESAKLGAGSLILKDVKPNVTMHGHMATEAKK